LNENENISIEIFEKYQNKIDWDIIWANKTITIEFIEENMEKLKVPFGWSNLCLNPNIPIEFFKKYSDKLDWCSLCSNENIPIYFFEENLDKINNWDDLCCNKFSYYLERVNKNNFSKVLKEIHDTFSVVPSNISPVLPNGGYEYLQVIEKYKL